MTTRTTEAVDTSVAVAAFGEWHTANVQAREVLDAGAAIPAHAMMETWSVLTGFPPPHRAPPCVVATWLDDRFAGRVLEPPTVAEHHDLVRRLADASRVGAAVYDALIALTAVRAGCRLVTADRRAADTYAIVGADHRMLVESDGG